MTGFSARVMPVVVLLLAAAARAQAQAQRFPAFDPERIFMLGDADLDGRLSLDEYRDFLRSSPRMRDAAATIEPMFRRLDADRDGFLSLAEYRKSFPQRPGGAAAKPGAPKEKPPGAAAAEAGITPEQERILRGEDPARPRHAMRQVPREHRREAAGRAPSRQPRGPPPRRRLRPGDRPRPARREPAHPGDPLPRRRAPDAPQGEAPRRGRRRLRGLDQDGRPRPADRAGRAPRGVRRSISRRAREFWSFRPPKKSAPPAGEAGGLAARRHRPLPPRGARSPRARPGRRRRPPEAPPPGDVRPHRPAAHARGARCLPRGRLARRLRARSSIGCSPRPASASAGAGTGSTWPAIAESSGKTNFSYPQAWRYRDWAIASFNADKPYDQFVREQIAGDLLPAEDDRERAEQIIATGFLALGSKAHDAENRGQFVLDVDRRADRGDHARLPRPDGRLRPLPRPQDGPDPPARLLRALRASSAARRPARARWRASSRTSTPRR